jgi:hypothetical protein
VALMMMGRNTTPLDRRGFYVFARELIPDLQPDVVDTALALAGTSTQDMIDRFADSIADMPPRGGAFGAEQIGPGADAKPILADQREKK